MARYLLYFAVFSILGWMLEVAFAALKHGRFVNRGFNSGPVCPIYGTCIALLRLILFPLSHTWLPLYLASVLLATMLELITGFVMDKIFDTKWWDYSANKFNLGGYICLSFSLIWGAFCVLIVKVFFPLVDTLYDITPPSLLYALLFIFFVLLLLDFLASIAIARGFDRHLKLLSDLSDILKSSSDRLGKGVYLGTKKAELLYHHVLEKTPLIYRRIADAFPTMRTKYYEQLSALRARIRQKTKKQGAETTLALPSGDTALTFDASLTSSALFDETSVSASAPQSASTSSTPCGEAPESASPILPDTPQSATPIRIDTPADAPSLSSSDSQTEVE